MPKKDRHHDDRDTFSTFNARERKPPAWEKPAEEDDASEFERRQQGVKRESVKRARTAQKEMREERDTELQSSRLTDRRAIEKELKRRYNDLKRIAEQLGIKQALQALNDKTRTTCWGPDVISDKNRPSIGVVLNYLGDSVGGGANPPSSLFGTWLYYRDNRVMIAVGNKVVAETDSHVQHAIPPSQRNRILEVPYDETRHAVVSEQITKAILNDGPIR